MRQDRKLSSKLTWHYGCKVCKVATDRVKGEKLSIEMTIDCLNEMGKTHQFTRKSIETIAKSSSIAGLVSVGLGICESILIVPLFLQVWGSEKYGLWGSLLAMVALLHSITIGFQTYAGNEFGKYYHSDMSRAGQVLGSAIRMILLLGVLELVVFAALVGSGGAARMLGLDLGDPRLAGLYGGVFCYGLSWLLIQGFGGLFIRVIMPIGEFSRSVILGILLQAMQICVLIVAAFNGWSIFATCLTMSIVLTVFSTSVILDVKRRLPHVFSWWKLGSLSEGVNLAIRSVTISAATVMEQFSLNGVSLLVTALLSPQLLPIWLTSRTVVNLGFQVSNQLLNPLCPEMVRFHATRDGEKLAQVIKASWIFVTVVVIIPMTIASPLLTTAYSIWTAGELTLDRGVFVLLTAGLCLNLTARPYFFYLYGLNAEVAQIVMSMTRTVLLLIVSITLAPALGLTAFAMGVFMAELGGGLLCRYYARKKLSDFGGNPPMRDECLVGGIALSATVAMALYLFLPEYKWFGAAIAVSMTVLLTILQWQNLSPSVRQRIKNSILPLKLRMT